MCQPTPQNYYPPPPPPPPPPQPWPPGAPLATGTYVQFQPQAMGSGSWSTGLFDCFSDITNCCITLVFPCITFGQIAEIVDRGSSSCGMNGALYTLLALVTGFQCIYSCFYRSKMRADYGLKEEPCPDLLVHGCLCELCSLCQMYRELNHRGFDPRIGWHANLERCGQLSAYPPPPQFMSR